MIAVSSLLPEETGYLSILYSGFGEVGSLVQMCDGFYNLLLRLPWNCLMVNISWIFVISKVLWYFICKINGDKIQAIQFHYFFEIWIKISEGGSLIL